jgi:hypothetical protein
MQNQQKTSKANPLASFMRQPKIYISLPSNGEFWNPRSIDMPESGEFPVYSMTARDELMFKTPDALMNGQAMVDVIQSCMPNIKNAWDVPTIDLDAILIAIRLATYGDRMPFNHKIPIIDEEIEYELDLRILLDTLQNNHWIEQIAVGPELIIFVKPLTYKHMTQTSLKSFETQRIFNVVNDEKIPDEEKMKMFNASFSNLTKLTVELMAESIYMIKTVEEDVTDKKFIQEFVANTDKEIFDVVQNHLKQLKEHNDIKPLEFSTTEEQQAQGAPEKYLVPVNFNNSDFFG